MGDLAAVAHESFDGALVVKTLGLEAQETQRFSDAAMRLRAERLVVGRLRAGFEPLLDALPALGTLLLLVVGAWRISTHDVTAGEVIQAATLFALLAFPMRVFGFFLEELPRAVSSVSRVDNVIAHADAADGPNFDEVGVVSTAGRPAGRAASLAFRNVSFGYGAASVLEDVSFHVEPGEVVALVGSTGSGKSTINELALRLLEPTNGSIEINGVELSSMMREEIAQQIALVFQESFLFAATLRENVMLGATLADHEAVEELSRVSELARIDHFLDVLSNGWETPLGERGVSLSGGQRQRVALARALMRRPSLLLLDDATSALDPEVESQILRGLATLETTVLIVAHRLSTITLADRVLFLDGGRIAESGTHQSLLANPRYAALVHAYERSSEGVEVEP
jgi:ABC-type multidrug transport system fused ATPase/permease subunit